METGMMSTGLMRVMLTRRETLRVRPGYRGLRVRTGHAWVTLAGRDLTLGRGQELALDSKDGPAVVSTLGRMPVVIELLGETPEGVSSLQTTRPE